MLVHQKPAPLGADTTNQRGLDSLAIHAGIYGLSKKYDIPDLMKVSCQRFVELVSYVVCVEPEAITDYVDDLVDAIKIVYGFEKESDRILQEAAIYLARHLARSVMNYGTSDKIDAIITAFRKAFRSIGNL